MKKNMLKKGLIFLVVLSGYVAVSLAWEASKAFRGEDNLIESLGAFFLLTASILYFSCYWLSSRAGKDSPDLHRKRNGFYVFLAVIFFIGFGEEISWGQRIFDWETPKILSEINRQGETNIHNIILFNDPRYRDGGPLENKRRPVLSILLDVDTWFFSFWFSYCLILPLLNQYSRQSSRYISRIGLPVPPLWIGLLLLVNFSMYAIPHLFSLLVYMDHSFNELRESYDGLIFSVLAHHELKKQLFFNKRVHAEEEEKTRI